MSTSSPPVPPHSSLASRLSSCPGCDKPFTSFDLKSLGVTDDEAREWVSTDEPMMLRIQKFPYYCERCINRIGRETSAEAEASRVRRVRYDAYHFGNMPVSARRETLEESSEEVMRRNPDVWMALSKVPLGKNVWIIGIPGTGKTFLAHCCANNHLDRGISAASVQGDQINQIGGMFDEKRAAALKPLKSVRLLVIDDIDKPTYTSRGIDALLAVMDARERSKLRTIFTANTTGAWCSRTWERVRPDNPSIAKSIVERMMPIDSYTLTGESLRSR